MHRMMYSVAWAMIAGVVVLGGCASGTPTEKLQHELGGEGANEHTVERLIGEGADVNAPDVNGNTPLMMAAIYGHPESARYLINAGAKVDVATADGRTPLFEAARHGHLKTVRLLLAHGAQPNIKTADGRTPIGEASLNGHVKIVEALRAAGAR
jgi:ankyrin repeat protein